MLTQGPLSGLLSHGQYSSESGAESPTELTSQPTPRFKRIDLNCMPILESVLNSLPAEILRKYRVVPFSLDREGARMRVACAEPSDPMLVAALADNLPSISCERFQADPAAVDRILDRFFPTGPQVAGTRSSATPVLFESVCLPSEEPELYPASPQRIVLFAIPDGKLSQHLQAAYTAQNYEPRVVRSLDAATRLVEQAPIAALFIHEDFRARSESLLPLVSNQGPRMTVRFFHTEADLLLNETGNEFSLSLHRKNLHLLRHLLDSDNGLRSAHSETVARLAELVGITLSCPHAMRENLLNAAFLHNLSEEDLTSTEGYSQPDLITLSASRLSTWDYPDSVTELLRGMSRLLATSPVEAAQSQGIASEILATVDFFCHEWPDHAVLDSEQLREVEGRLNQRFGSTVSPRIMRALFNIVREQFATTTRRQPQFHIHICTADDSPVDQFSNALLKAGFQIESSNSVDECVKICARTAPQALVVCHTAAVADLNDLLLSLALRGIRIDSIPTLLLVHDSKVNSALALLRHGLDDIIPAGIDPAVLVTKLTRIKERIEDRDRLRVAVLQELGTHGSLEDMNLVDLLEAMRANRRPVQVSLTANGNHLTVVIDQGKVVLAECEGHRGIGAIMQGLGWKRGVWSIDPIIPEQLPKSDFSEPVDAILLEACVQMDNSSAGCE